MSSFLIFFVTLALYHTASKNSIETPAALCPRNFSFDTEGVFRYDRKTSKLDSRAAGAKGPAVRKVRAPQGKDNG